MTTLHSAAPYALKLVISKYRPGPIAGPALSAIRASVDLGAPDMSGFAPLFEQIGQQLDAAIAEPKLDRYLTDERPQILVAISDADWRGAALFASYAVEDVEALASGAGSVIAGSIADLERAGRPATPKDCLVAIWSVWTRAERKRIRSGAAEPYASPDVQVGSLLAWSPQVRGQLTAIAFQGAAVPVLVIGLNASRPDRKKWKLRAAVCALPKWSLYSGAVAGRA